MNITFVVAGQRTDGATRGAGIDTRTPPLGLGGSLKASVRVGSTRAGEPMQRLEAVPGRDIVVLHVSNGPSLVLHPEHARDLLMAQSGQPHTGAAPTTVEVPAQLRWAGLEAAADGTARGATRGWLGDVLIAGIDLVTDHLKDRAQDAVAGVLVKKIDDQVDEGVYALQAQALPSLKGRAPVPQLPAANGAPLLVFVHGTFSDTASGFGKLWVQHPQRVRALFERYADRVFALDHRTLGASPIENALTLVRACPTGTRLHLVTHSRGGLVAEVLARAGAMNGIGDAELAQFAVPAQRAALKELVGRMSGQDIRVERIVRVACPARGTLLASQRLDAYVSILKWALELAQVPVLPALLDFLGGVAQRREDPARIPGIEAMIPDSPLVRWLHDVDEPVPGQLRVVAGDLQGDSIGSWAKTLIADAFYRTDNDLVVHTASMYGGAPREAGASYLLDVGGQVTHFNYFGNARSAEAIVDALLQDQPGAFRPIGPLSWAGESATGQRGAARAARAASRGTPQSDLPAVFVLPGILGSNLKVDGKRIWLGWRLLNGLKRLEYPEAAGVRVEPDGPVGMVYEDLMDFLAESHEVIEFSFDWRRPIEQEAKRLAQAVDAALAARDQSGQPVRLLAHSMGGLVARTMQLEARPTWDRLMARPGARLLMLGTPNGGSWAPMQVLSGDDTFGNTLVAFGAPFQDRSARRMMAQFPGFIQLQADLLQGGERPLERHESWQALADDDLKRVREHNWWHSDERQLEAYEWGVPAQAVLDAAVQLRRRLDAQRDTDLPAFADKLALVIGHARFTPDGYELREEGLVYLTATEAGDGRVPVASAMLPGVATWKLDCEHGTLPDEEDAFGAYLELLQTGTTSLLPRVAAPMRGQAAAAAPLVVRVPSRPSRERRETSLPVEADALVRAVPAGALPPVAAPRARLHVRVRNGDLKFVREPLMVGHYRSTQLTGTEHVIDRLIDGTMSESLAMGQYPDAPGTHQVFLNCGVNKDNPLQLPRPESVIVVGLGPEGWLKPRELRYSVRLGVLALAQRLVESPRGVPAQFELAATLLGSGGVDISAGQAAQLIAQGVRDADAEIARTNQRLQQAAERRPDAEANTPRRWPRVARLHLIELYLDRAGEAWRALQVLAESEPDALAIEPQLQFDMGALRRPLDGGYRGADYDLLRAVSGHGEDRIEYTVNTKRARQEVHAQSTQTRLLRELVRKASNRPGDARIGRALFQLLVPIGLEPYLGGSGEMLLELDGGTAAIPWEMLDTDAGAAQAGAGRREPWAVRTSLVRKLQQLNFRSHVVDAGAEAHVLVIGEPDTDNPPQPAYASLPGARSEARAVVAALKAPGALPADQVVPLIRAEGATQGPDASTVIAALGDRTWRIVHIAGHGEPPKHRDDGTLEDPRGVVLSSGTFLGPREIESLRVVPELVFVNCCHLARREPGEVLAAPRAGDFDRSGFAATVAEALIRIGVRCVVAAGWAVDDAAAEVFSVEFYAALLRGQRFIDAVGAARRATLAEGGNTWAAYQCYGDPDWTLRRGAGDAQRPPTPLADEFAGVASPVSLALALETLAVRSRFQGADPQRQRERLRHLVARFATAWGDIGAVAEAFAVAWDAAGDRAEAIEWYRRALTAADGSASMKAAEQHANLRVRQAWKQVDKLAFGAAPDAAALQAAARTARTAIGEAIADLERLIVAAGTLERQSLLGSAHKRLAMIARAVGDDAAVADALAQMKQAYRLGEAAGAAAGVRNLFYPRQNQLAADAAAHAGDAAWAGPDPALLAATRQSLLAQAAADPDFWSVVGLTELQLLQALAARKLAGAQRELLAQYADLHERVRSPGDWGSVLDQLRFLLPGYVDRVGDAQEQQAAKDLVARIEQYAAA